MLRWGRGSTLDRNSWNAEVGVGLMKCKVYAEVEGVGLVDCGRPCIMV